MKTVELDRLNVAEIESLRGSLALPNVSSIVNDVRRRGDRAVLDYTVKFDGVRLKSLRVERSEIKKAYKVVSLSDVRAIKRAIGNVRKFAKAQLAQLKDFETETEEGVRVGQRVIPIERVGVYVPGGNFPLPSSAIMSVVPAKLAGVREIVLCSPPTHKGSVNPVTVVAADLAGATSIYRAGGVQAIAAMAYGTDTIPRVDKIVGPGNKYVVAAKKTVFGDVGIDFVAGPSEVLVIADSSANPAFVAADMLSQAEHDADASAILVTNSRSMAESVKREIKAKLKDLRTASTAKKSLDRNGLIVVVRRLKTAADFANIIAPEHLEVMVGKQNALVKKLKNYGSLFIGPYSAEVLGDYVSGTNHILPTASAARYAGGLSVRDFVKIQTYQRVTKRGFEKIGKTAARLAELEGLDAHKKAAEIRSGKR